MGRYTELLEDTSIDLINEDWDVEDLNEAVKLFRPFDVALTTFMKETGLVGDDATQDDIIKAVKEGCKREGIETPRSIKRWFSNHTTIKRSTAFDLCFALGLDLAQSMDFLRRICLVRGFDKHDMKEIAYYFAIREGLDYGTAQDIIAKVDTVNTDKKIDDEHMVYTQTIASDIDGIHTPDELIDYLTENRDSFGYNNATAFRFIRTLWEEISGDDGLAAKERDKVTSEISGQKRVIPYGRYTCRFLV